MSKDDINQLNGIEILELGESSFKNLPLACNCEIAFSPTVVLDISGIVRRENL